MTNEPDQSPDERESVAQEISGNAEKTTKPKKKATKKRNKSTTAKSKRRRSPTKTLAPPPPLTIEELKEQGVQAKQEVINAVVEPAVAVVGSLSQTIRDTISGAFAGLLSRKRSDD